MKCNNPLCKNEARTPKGYCSSHCCKVHYPKSFTEEQKAAMRHRKKVHVNLNRICVICKKDFTVTYDSEKTECCSVACNAINYSNKVILRYKLIREANIESTRRVCTLCGDEYFSNSKKRKYCSRKCSDKRTDRVITESTKKKILAMEKEVSLLIFNLNPRLSILLLRFFSIANHCITNLS